jgi:hypothetical protein
VYENDRRFTVKELQVLAGIDEDHPNHQTEF